MGGLFSSSPSPQTQSPTRIVDYGYQPPASRPSTYHNTVSTRNTHSTNQNIQHESYNIWRDFESLSLGRIYAGDHRESQWRQVRPPVRSVKDPSKCYISSDPCYQPLSAVTYIELSTYDSEYLEISRKVTNKRKFKIDGIEKIENPYLKRAYALKKEQKKQQYSYVEERLLFHGTPRANVEKICKFNFDWRLCKAHKYGKGVSFSPNSTYASNYSDKHIYNKVMIVAKVMIGRSCSGHEKMELPDPGCDTSQKGADGIVIVKYEDNEFLPMYKINYHLAQENINNRGRRVTRNFYDFDDFFD